MRLAKPFKTRKAFGTHFRPAHYREFVLGSARTGCCTIKLTIAVMEEPLSKSRFAENSSPAVRALAERVVGTSDAEVASQSERI
jgi:hypothetical protein